MSADDLDPQALLPEYGPLLEAQLLRKAAAEADLAEARARQQQAINRQLLKSAGDGPPSPGIIPGQESQPPGGDGTDETAAPVSAASAPAPAYEAQAKPREGTVTADAKAGYMATIVAYRAMLRQADAIADSINALHLSNARIMLVNSPEFAAGDVALQQVSAQFEAWKAELTRLNKLVTDLAHAKADDERLIAPAFLAAAVPIAAGAIAAGVSPATMLPLLAATIGATADLIGYFKTDYALTGRDVSVSDTAVRARVAGKLRGVPVYMQDFYRVEDAPIMGTFNAIISLRAALSQNLDLLKSQVIGPLEFHIAALTADIEQLQAQMKKLKLPADQSEKERLEGEIAKATKALTTAVNQKRPLDLLYARGAGAISAWDAVNKDLTAVPAGGQLSLLTQAAQRDTMNVMNITHLLYVAVASAGGEMITGKNWFLGAPQVGYLGGGAVMYMLAEVGGAICAADTLAGTDYLKVKLGQDVLE
jgi:hypothetical protein